MAVTLQPNLKISITFENHEIGSDSSHTYFFHDDGNVRRIPGHDLADAPPEEVEPLLRALLPFLRAHDGRTIHTAAGGQYRLRCWAHDPAGPDR